MASGRGSVNLVLSSIYKRREAMKAGIKNRDFEHISGHIMADSSQFYAVYLNITPAISYMNDVSWATIRAVKGLNTLEGRAVGAYTFGAGPNVVLYYQDKDEEKILGFMEVLHALDVAEWTEKYATVASERYDSKPFKALKDGLSRVILTRAEEGPIRANNIVLYTD